MNLKKHSGALAIATSWLGGAYILSKHQPDIHEAISQYSVHGDTWIPFGVTVTISSFFLAIFGGYLSNYWTFAKHLMRLAALLLIITAWTPYGNNSLPNFIHITSFISSVFVITLVLWRTTMSFYPQLSNALLLAFIVSGTVATAAFLLKKWSFHLELTMLAFSHIWLLLVAYAPGLLAPLSSHSTDREPAALG